MSHEFETILTIIAFVAFCLFLRKLLDKQHQQISLPSREEIVIEALEKRLVQIYRMPFGNLSEQTVLTPSVIEDLFEELERFNIARPTSLDEEDTDDHILLEDFLSYVKEQIKNQQPSPIPSQ